MVKKNKLIKCSAGFTVVELLMVIVIVGLLTAASVGSYVAYVDRMDIAEAEADIYELERRIAEHHSLYKQLPTNLGDVNANAISDPWGNGYVYMRISNLGVPAGNVIQGDVGNERTGQGGAALNTDYDLYSLGKDGVSSTAITGSVGQDDVIRANNGRFIGKAEYY